LKTMSRGELYEKAKSIIARARGETEMLMREGFVPPLPSSLESQ